VGRFGQSTPETVRESHAIVRSALDGELDPSSQRVKRAWRVASKYPLESLESPGSLEPGGRRLNLGSRRVDQERHEHYEPPLENEQHDGRFGTDRDMMMDVVFGSAAPYANTAIDMVVSPIGKQVAGVVGIVLGTALIAEIGRRSSS